MSKRDAKAGLSGTSKTSSGAEAKSAPSLRGIKLVSQVIEELSKRSRASLAVGAGPRALDALESKLMVELPPTLREFLSFDFTFASLPPRFVGRRRFGSDPKSPAPRITSVAKLSQAMTDQGWSDSRIKGKVVRLPNKKGKAWNALYLGEARRDGELPILGLELEGDGTDVRVFPRYTAFDLYIAEQAGLITLSNRDRLDDLDTHLAHNPELSAGDEEDEADNDF